MEDGPFRGLRAPFLPGVPGHQSQTLDVLSSRVHQGVRQSRLGGWGGDTEMALNNTESYGKKVPLPFSSTPADYSRRKSLVPANMSLTPL